MGQNTGLSAPGSRKQGSGMGFPWGAGWRIFMGCKREVPYPFENPAKCNDERSTWPLGSVSSWQGRAMG